MKLWTIQTEEAYRHLQENGYLRGDANWIDPDFFMAYDWLVNEMKSRIGSAPDGCFYPLWAWYQFDGHSKRMPDLRTGGFLEKGTRGVRLEIEIPENDVLLSDFETWHYVLNNYYLNTSDSDAADFENDVREVGGDIYSSRPVANPDLQKRIQTSWSRIFDLDGCVAGISKPRTEKTIQAVIWELQLHQVRKVRFFTAR